MKIRDVYTKETPVFSLEFFPPKKKKDIVYSTLEELIEYHPKFVSVTSKSDGTNRDETRGITARIKNEYDIEAMPHLTCISLSEEEITRSVESMKRDGLENIMALRGDPPEVERKHGYNYASELIRHIRRLDADICIGAAGYPETHIEAESPELDLAHLKEKVDNGADFILTQMFFKNDYYYRFLEKTAKLGISVPIIPGIMPVFSYKNITRFAEMCGTEIPPALQNKMERFKEDDESVHKLGIEFAVEQCIDLLENGVKGLHFYTMNKTHQMKEILRELTKVVERV